MATVQVILNGMPGGTQHDTDNYPVILQFDEEKDYGGGMLSEIRVEGGPLECFVEGPEGFQSGPHETNWVRSDYPRGKLCSFLQMDATTHTMGGVSVQVVEGTLVVDEVSVGKKSS